MQAAAAPFSHGEMLYIHELDGVSHVGRSVRTLGRCIAYDTEHQTVDLEHNRKTLRVDVSLVEEQFPFAVGGMFQVIGEVFVRVAVSIHLPAVEHVPTPQPPHMVFPPFVCALYPRSCIGTAMP